MTKITFYSLRTFQSPTGKNTIGDSLYISYKKPIMHTRDGTVLGTETKAALNIRFCSSAHTEAEMKYLTIFIHWLSLTFLLNKKILS